jgi:hypothetical protein
MKRRTQKLTNDARRLGAWRAWHHEEREAALAGPHGAVLHKLFRMFKNLQRLRPVQLIDLARTIDWASVDYDAKLTVVHECNMAIAKFREVHGLAPFDDGSPGEPDTPFRANKAIVLAPFPSCKGANRGAARLE